ncbi:MAG: DJ/PfpI family protein [Myxococcales bacterium]|nr:DJ/PfpI family protein [Myxococcales bacterium]
MRVVFFAFDGLTLLDLVGAYDALRRVQGVRITVLGTGPSHGDDGGLRIATDGVLGDLAPYDLLVVPGGLGTRPLQKNTRILEWLRSWGERRPVASVCTGSLLLGHAGFLRGLPATTHFSAYEELRPLCAEVVEDRRVVDAGRVITAGAVSSSLDLGLHLVERFFGSDERQRVSRAMAHELREIR